MIHKLHNFSYENFLEHCTAFKTGSVHKTLLELNQNDKHFHYTHSPFGCCLIHYPSQKYLFVSSNVPRITGYSRMEIEKGPLMHLCRFVPEDREIFTNRLFPDILKFLSNVPVLEFRQYRFSFSYRLIRKDGSIAHFLQHSIYFEPTSDGLPMLNLATFTDISDFAPNNALYLSISVTDNSVYKNVFRKAYISEKTNFTQRELQILAMSLKGLSSRSIAERLHLSTHTIKNHKRNMMEKTSTNSIEELIHCAMKQKLIE